MQFQRDTGLLGLLLEDDQPLGVLRVPVSDAQRQALAVTFPNSVAAALVESRSVEVLARLFDVELARLDLTVVVVAESELEGRQALVVAAQDGVDDAVEVHGVGEAEANLSI